MNHWLSYFDKIYCINLESRKDRLENCEKQFSEFGFLNVRKINAIKFNHPQLSKKSNAQIGCALSHYLVLKDAKINNYSKIMVLEDDFSFTKNVVGFHQKMNWCISELPFNWDTFYLGAYFVKGYDYNPTSTYSPNLVKVHTGFCCHSICYSSFGIDKLFKKLKLETVDDILSFSQEYESIDWFLVREFQNTANCFAVNELLCEQIEGFSDIEQKVQSYHNNFSESYKQYIFDKKHK